MRLFVYTATYGCPVLYFGKECFIIGWHRALWICWGQKAKDDAYNWAIGLWDHHGR